MFKRFATFVKQQVRPFGILGLGLILIGTISALGGVWQYRTNLAQVSTSSSPKVAGTPTKSFGPAPSGTPAPNQPPPSVNLANSNIKTSTSSSSSIVASSTPAQSAPPAQAPVMVTVSLRINGTNKGNVILPSTSKQCEVLTRALNDGLISSLFMPYDAAQHTYGVYQINGLGDPTIVWWTYTVNGSPPPLGCSYLTVHNGDSVNWQYIKS